MDELEWVTCADPAAMLEFLRTRICDPSESRSGAMDAPNKTNRGFFSGKAARRKLRLFAGACVRRANVVAGPDRLNALRMSDEYADGLIDQSALAKALASVRKLPEPIPCDADMALSVFGPTDMRWEASAVQLLVSLGPELDAQVVARKAVEIVIQSSAAGYRSRRSEDERRQQAHLLRDIFGNPFHPVPLDLSWLTARTRSLASSIYEQRRFANLTVLARALKQDAGGAHRELSNHCQSSVPHVRGCWVVDLVLGHS